MSVELDPVELGFQRPFTREVAQSLRLRNPNNEPVVFKVKTTAPKQYCVRPNSGRIEAGQEVEVKVLLQAMKEDPPLDAKCRDKFLVQSVAVLDDREFDNVASIWSNIEKNARSSIQEKKIRVSFLPVEGYTAPPSANQVNGVGQHDISEFASSPPGEARTPLDRSTYSISQQQTGDEPPPVYSQSEVDLNKGTGNSDHAAASFKDHVIDAVPKSVDELRTQLSDAMSTIKVLKQQAEQGLRQRTVGGSSKGANQDGTSTTSLQSHQSVATGVPLQIVAILCLLSFLLGYVFF